MFRRFLLWMALCIAPLAHAQFVSVYVTFSPLNVSDAAAGSNCSGSSCTQLYTNYWAYGIGGGATVNFFNVHIIKLGVDARGSTKSGTSGADTFEGALKLTVQPPFLHIKPYIQGGGGYLDTRAPNKSTTSTGAPIGGTVETTYATAGFHAGLDVPVMHFVDLRVAEVGYAKAFNGSGVTDGTRNPNLFSFNTGLVLHF